MAATQPPPAERSRGHGRQGRSGELRRSGRILDRDSQSLLNEGQALEPVLDREAVDWNDGTSTAAQRSRPVKQDTHRKLEGMLQRWTEWSRTADRSEDGWQSDFPEWGRLMARAAEQMGPKFRPDQVALIGRCWEISDETEDLLDYAMEHVEACWRAIEAVAQHGAPAARWQAYVAAASGGAKSETLLRAALCDPDDYARRRGALCLAQLRPPDSKQIAESLLCEEDPYLRQAAIGFVLAVGDSDFQRAAYEKLAGDSEEHVRKAARDRLSDAVGVGGA